MRNQSNLGPLTPYHPPSVEALRTYNVNRAGQLEVIWQPQYDYQSYLDPGATQFTFFQTPLGQNGTTLADTSMKSAGQFPRPTEFLVTGIQVLWLPGKAIAEVGVATAQTNWQDAFDVLFGDAWLQLFIGSKPYLDDGPLAKFPPQFRLGGTANITGTTTADDATFVDYASAVGRYYSLTPVKLTANQNFNVTLNFPTAIAVDDANDDGAVIGVILDGFLYRLSQ